MNLDNDKVILVDCDGVLLNWEYAFTTWLQRHGYEKAVDDKGLYYKISEQFGISDDEANALIKTFNESSSIGFLPPLRDAMYYVDKLHREHGYVFHALTALSTEPSAQELRRQNLYKLFGESTFEKIAFVGTGAGKTEILEPYRNSGYLWVEDHVGNAFAGRAIGLDSVLMEHGFNMNDKNFLLMKNWKEIYNYIIGE